MFKSKQFTKNSSIDDFEDYLYDDDFEDFDEEQLENAAAVQFHGASTSSSSTNSARASSSESDSLGNQRSIDDEVTTLYEFDDQHYDFRLLHQSLEAIPLSSKPKK